jgi:hypothetical protein
MLCLEVIVLDLLDVKFVDFMEKELLISDILDISIV